MHNTVDSRKSRSNRTSDSDSYWRLKLYDYVPYKSGKGRFPEIQVQYPLPLLSPWCNVYMHCIKFYTECIKPDQGYVTSNGLGSVEISLLRYRSNLFQFSYLLAHKEGSQEIPFGRSVRLVSTAVYGILRDKTACFSNSVGRGFPWLWYRSRVTNVGIVYIQRCITQTV
jgi:hypothetical protein